MEASPEKELDRLLLASRGSAMVHDGGSKTSSLSCAYLRPHHIDDVPEKGGTSKWNQCSGCRSMVSYHQKWDVCGKK